MALTSLGAFAAGFAAGWIGRSVVGSTREALVQAIVTVHKVRDGVKRVLAEQVEWAEDLVAEGRARYEELHAGPPLDDELPPQVLDLDKLEKRGRAA
jgi:hypothetical protein